MATSMGKKEVRALLKSARTDGATVVEKKDGVVIRPASGGSIMLHWSCSDWRALANTRAEFRRLGLSWPWDGTTRRKKRT